MGGPERSFRKKEIEHEFKKFWGEKSRIKEKAFEGHCIFLLASDSGRVHCVRKKPLTSLGLILKCVVSQSGGVREIHHTKEN